MYVAQQVAAPWSSREGFTAACGLVGSSARYVDAVPKNNLQLHFSGVYYAQNDTWCVQRVWSVIGELR